MPEIEQLVLNNLERDARRWRYLCSLAHGFGNYPFAMDEGTVNSLCLVLTTTPNFMMPPVTGAAKTNPAATKALTAFCDTGMIPQCTEPLVPTKPTRYGTLNDYFSGLGFEPDPPPKLPDDATQLAKLPRTAEGVLVVPGMIVWSKPSSGPPHSFLVHSIYEGKQIGLWLPANGYAVAAASDKCYYIKPTE